MYPFSFWFGPGSRSSFGSTSSAEPESCSGTICGCANPATTRISRSQLQPGDLVFYRNNAHVGIYVGGGQIIDPNPPRHRRFRKDVMAALAATQGEASARKKVQQITEMFHGLLPGSLSSRPSPLMG